MSFELAGYWAPSEDLDVACTSLVAAYKILVWPAGVVEGHARLERDENESLRRIALELSPPPRLSPPSRLNKAIVDCPVREDGRFRCPGPATAVDLVVRVPGQVPIYRWGVPLKPGEITDLGQLVFKKGASLSGWVEVEGGELRPEAVAKATMWQAPGHGSSPTIERLKKGATEAGVTTHGFFQLTGLPPGSYSIEVSQPGFAATRAYPIDVWGDSETFLRQPIVLRKPLTLELSISPPLDWLGRPWQVEVRRGSEFSGSLDLQAAYEGPAGRDGSVRISGQAPGSFQIVVGDKENPLHFEYPRFVNSEEEAEISISLPLIWVEGTIAAADEPFLGTAIFGGRHGAVHVSLETDDEGRFSGVIPRGGRWPVDILTPDRRLAAQVHTLVKPSSEGRARLSLKIPNTLVRGRVVDEKGNPARDAWVYADSGPGSKQERSALDGKFEIVALPEGPVVLQAEGVAAGEEGASDPVVVDLKEDDPAGPVELVLLPRKSLRARVVGPRGPVAGAHVALGSDIKTAHAMRERSDHEGRFETEIWGSARRLTAIISPPGNALTAIEVPYSDGEVLLRVAETGGALEVVVAKDPKLLDDGFTLEISQNGLGLPLSELHRWAAGHGQPLPQSGPMRIPNLAPGSYSVCIVPWGAMFGLGDVQEASRAKACCASGELAPGGSLRLELSGRGQR